jgi:hypothetical protein
MIGLTKTVRNENEPRMVPAIRGPGRKLVTASIHPFRCIITYYVKNAKRWN